MSNTMHLIGAEDVRRAGSAIASAAEDMRLAASSMDEVLHRHQLFMTQWLSDFAAIMEKKP